MASDVRSESAAPSSASRTAWGYGLATVAGDGTVANPYPHAVRDADEGAADSERTSEAMALD